MPPIRQKRILSHIVGDEAALKDAFDELDRFGWSIEELRAYDSVDMKLSSDRACLFTAKSEGIEIGENKKAIAIAKAMLAEGLPIEMITKMTGLEAKDLSDIKAATQQV